MRRGLTLTIASPRGESMHRILTASLLVAPLILATGCAMEQDLGGASATTEKIGAASDTSVVYDALARHWAPRFYQDTDSTEYKSEYLTKINFDGDYNSKNNWESMDAFSTVPAYVYYSVVESETHFFLGYYTFHPRDWCDSDDLFCGEHENDLEGVLLVVRNDGASGGMGSLVAAFTEAHGQIYQYAYAGGLTTGSDNIDGTLTLSGSHPRFFIEAKGHGVFNCDSRCTSAPGGDGIVYTVGDVAESPASGSGNWTRVHTYQLIAFDETTGDQGLWARRNDVCDTCTFGSWGHMRGDGLDSQNSATMPWSWDDSDDGEVFSGALLCDPAQLVDTQLNGTPVDSGFSHDYVFHPYVTHVLEILAVRSDADRDSLGNASDIYVKVTSPGAPEGGDDVIDARTFKKNSATVGTYYNWQRGAFDAEGQRRYSEVVRTHRFCRRGRPAVTLSVYDSDDNGDDHMGSVSCTTSCDHSAGIDLGDSRLKFRLTVNN
jgi:hypothetical protein